MLLLLWLLLAAALGVLVLDNCPVPAEIFQAPPEPVDPLYLPMVDAAEAWQRDNRDWLVAAYVDRSPGGERLAFEVTRGRAVWWLYAPTPAGGSEALGYAARVGPGLDTARDHAVRTPVTAWAA